jgi:succinate dehydrogenase / fumarate reductase cytochrome b subunit
VYRRVRGEAKALALHPGARHPRKGIGWWAWLLQRISGVALVIYLLAHIGVISTSLLGAGGFDRLLRLLQSPPFVVMDLGLLGAVLYHGLNGLRVILFDLGIGIKAQGGLFWASLGLTLALVGAAAYLSLPLIVR